MSKTLEKRILELMPEGDDFNVYAYGLMRERDGGWSMNDGWRLGHHLSREEVLEIARGRWDVFRINYAPKARVKDLEDIGYLDTCSEIECDHMSFLRIEVVTK